MRRKEEPLALGDLEAGVAQFLGRYFSQVGKEGFLIDFRRGDAQVMRSPGDFGQLLCRVRREAA